MKKKRKTLDGEEAGGLALVLPLPEHFEAHGELAARTGGVPDDAHERVAADR
jgi:hypothetical protein